MKIIGSKKNARNVAIALGFLLAMIWMNAGAVLAQNGPPTQSQVFLDQNSGIGHTFNENYWDIMVHNNSKWEVGSPKYHINNMTTWINNTWNVKWISEGNFQMGMLAFMNKTGDNIAAADKYYTPSQFWWMHYYYQGHEMLIGNMLAAWFGFNDTAKTGNYVPVTDDLNPFFYMTMIQPSRVNSTAFSSLNLHPSVQVTPLQRTTGGSQINYTWAYNYTDITFWLPALNHNNSTFRWGFNYTDPGTYMQGSFGLGEQAYIYYSYTLVLDSSLQQATLYSNYKSGDITNLWLRNDSKGSSLALNPFIHAPNSQIPRSWILCTGNWAFIMAGVDKKAVLNDTAGNSITANTTRNGVTDVYANVNGTNVFNYEFSKKTTYTQYAVGNPANHTTVPVLYASIGITNNTGFLNLVAGMPQLMGSFARLMISYAINQTNHFTDGITFDKAWGIFDPSGTAAFFITGYPQFGPYQGGAIDHDPVFTALFTPGSSWGASPSTGSDMTMFIFIAIGAGVAGIVTIEGTRKKRMY
ncbi:MAG TPA: hypothetical protein VKM55_19390 [Candidatus Lokiarchaeia archaeon]|nr:hypothetical protein [Candidatus Lokiarchaeia archaeon]